MKKEMMRHSRKIVALLDSTKLETVSTANFCSAKDVDILITDSGAKSEILEKYRNAGIQVEQAAVKAGC